MTLHESGTTYDELLAFRQWLLEQHTHQSILRSQPIGVSVRVCSGL